MTTLAWRFRSSRKVGNISRMRLSLARSRVSFFNGQLMSTR
ncbi:MAG: hypothetical protein A4E30_01670 [Methanomassiliicoccales archaeon PtaB.Bin215]|nr:MAG: hypothetical protein A4E30_01670 [Methanomassiliicoccales archaeon PtaB.Bin215]